jgi:signal transduction histidine kinase
MNDQTELASADDPEPPQRWIAYELHDGLLQWVAGARMQVEAAISDIDQDSSIASDQAEWSRGLRAALTYLDAAAEEGRALISFLEQDASHENATFEAALTEFVETLLPDTERNAQSITLDLGQIPELAEVVRWNLLRIVQQALRNAVQHAGPARISVRSRLCPDGDWQLEVQDQGGGFQTGPESRLPNHFGLESMEMRAKLIKAQLQITSEPGAGCRVICTLPRES